MASKVLALGPPSGQLKPFLAKLAALHAKHSFALAVVAGDFFSAGVDEEEVELLLEGKLDVPLPTYITSSGLFPLPARVLAHIATHPNPGSATRPFQLCNNVLLVLDRVVDAPGGLTIGALKNDADGGERQGLLGSRAIPLESTGSAAAAGTGVSGGASGGGGGGFAELQAAALAAKQNAVTSLSAPKGIDILLLPLPNATLLASSPTCPPALKAAAARASMQAGGGGGEEGVDEVVRRARARYVFFPPPPPPPAQAPPGNPAPDDGSTTQIFFEREPYPSDPSGSSNAVVERFTRVLQLGRFMSTPPPSPSPAKPTRSFYAFNLAPPLPPGAKPAAPPPNATPNPFAPTRAGAAAGVKRVREPLEEQGFIWGKMPGGGGGRGGKRSRQQGGERPAGAARERKEPIMMAECWFCLSNPNVTKHLIVAIGDEVYVTAPKGPLVAAPKEGKVVLVDGVPVEKDKEEGVPGGGHVLIIPISHHTTIASIPADEKPSVNAEIGGVLDSLKACYAAYGHSAVGFEVGRLSARGGHAHIQVVPVPSTLAPSVEEAFRKEGAKSGMAFEEQKTLDGKEGRDNYFRLILPDGRQLVHWLEPRERFDLQFGRSVLANLLGTPNRLDWKACVGPGGEAEEKRDASAFKKAYERFDGSG